MNKLAFLGLLAAASLPILAQTPQIPTLQVCNLTGGAAVITSGLPLVQIPSRATGGFAGDFNVAIRITCDPTTGFPSGSVVLPNISMNDKPSPFQGSVSSVTVDQVTSTSFVNPTVFVSGRCSAQGQSTPGALQTIPCHYWIMVKNDGDSNASPATAGEQIVSFLVVDKNGKRIVSATGRVIFPSGVILVPPTTN